ncbi:hypothetical protein BT96DRAFT_1074060 [Gymnopus androsaceus JB14]|uniref:Uncharacterized protein n=1 Tax=Gymnopus androsaceus JB14 TaxID=1447944 RepID=A0A6A4GSH8_9AGAR|nr:hypothetical protein BT96DRAFT_1074060 [Gymnopus androsaceus JB14]
MSSSVHFPSTAANTLPRAPGLKRAVRVPNHKASNRHIACVGENEPYKVTFCSSFENTYTTVTFKPPKRRVMHSDAGFFRSSTRRSLAVEKEAIKGPAVVEGKTKMGYRKLLKMKVHQLLQRNSSVSTVATASDTSSSSSSSSTASSSTQPTHSGFASCVAIEPSRKGTSLFHFGRPRNTSNASKAATVALGMTSANRTPNAPVKSVLESFAALALSMTPDRSSLAAHIALDQAARELAESLNRESSEDPSFHHFFQDREWEDDDEETLARISDHWGL